MAVNEYFPEALQHLENAVSEISMFKPGERAGSKFYPKVT
jgi:hypothetical protein